MTAAPVFPIEAAASRGGGALTAGLAAIAAAAVALNLTGTPNHDVAWLLTGTQRLLEGGEFGRDVVDVNPPLAWWISAMPLALGRLAGIGPIAAFSAFTILLCLAGIGLARAALARSADQMPGQQGFLLFSGAVLMVAPGYDFGEREHLMAIAAFPYVAAAAARASGVRLPSALGWTIGLFAGLGFCLKPHFLLVPAAVELWRWWSTKKMADALRAETFGIAATALAYLGAVLLWAPTYLSTVVPEAALTYWAYGGSLLDAAAELGEALAPAGLAIAILAFALGRTKVPPLATAFFAAGVGAAAAALLQMKGWSYHLLPAVCLAALACTAALFGSAAALGSKARAAAILLVLFGTFSASWDHLVTRYAPDGKQVRVERLAGTLAHHAGPSGSVFAFVTSPRDAHPAVALAGVGWSGSACCLHHLPAHVRAGERPEAERAAIRAAAAGQLDEILARLEREQPAVILFDLGSKKLGFRDTPFDYRLFLRQDPRFERLLRSYRDRGIVSRYRLLVRIPAGAS